MASKIIKQGTKRAIDLQQFSFTEDSARSLPLMERIQWPDLSDSPLSVSANPAIAEESTGSRIDTDRLEREAFEKGFRKGEISGRDVAEKELEAEMKRYADSVLNVSSIKPALYAQAEKEVVKLAIEVAKKIVHREIQVDRNIIQTLVRVALSHVTEKSSITVRLNPVDYKYVTERHEELAQAEGRDISLQSDNTIEQGGCLIETKCGDIDARIQERFSEVENAFFEDLK
jgi:flagellar assembly protein FliH